MKITFTVYTQPDSLGRVKFDASWQTPYIPGYPILEKYAPEGGYVQGQCCFGVLSDAIRNAENNGNTVRIVGTNHAN